MGVFFFFCNFLITGSGPGWVPADFFIKPEPDRDPN